MYFDRRLFSIFVPYETSMRRIDANRDVNALFLDRFFLVLYLIKWRSYYGRKVDIVNNCRVSINLWMYNKKFTSILYLYSYQEFNIVITRIV